MSVQSEFLKSLFDELIARGVSEETARENVTKFQSQLKKKAEVDGNEKIDSALTKIPPASVAENIYNMLKAESDSDAGARSEVVVIDTESDTIIKTVREGKEAAAPLVKDTEVKAEDTEKETEENADTTEKTEADTADTADDGGDGDDAENTDSEEAAEEADADAEVTEETECDTEDTEEKTGSDADTEVTDEAEEASEEESTEENTEDTAEENPSEPANTEENTEENDEDTDASDDSVNVSEDVTEDVAEDVTEDVSSDVAEDVTEDVTEDAAEDAAEDVSDELDQLFDEKKEQDAENSDEASEESEEEENDDDLKVFQLPGEDDDSLKEYEPGKKRRVHSAGVHSVAQTPPGQRKTVRRTTESIDLFDGEETKKSNWLFYVFAIILVPIVAVIGAILFAIVLTLWLALAVVSTLLIVAVFGISAVGALFSLLGIIYGLIELIGGNIPGAMFEIGLALTVGSIVLFVGIIIYNVAVRFVPFIIKKLGVLLVLIFKSFGKAFRKFKKLCASI